MNTRYKPPATVRELSEEFDDLKHDLEVMRHTSVLAEDYQEERETISARITALDAIVSEPHKCAQAVEISILQNDLSSWKQYLKKLLVLCLVLFMGTGAGLAALGYWMNAAEGETAVSMHELEEAVELNTQKDNDSEEDALKRIADNVGLTQGKIRQSEFRILSAMAKTSPRLEAPDLYKYKEARERELRDFNAKHALGMSEAAVKRRVASEVQELTDLGLAMK